MQEQLDRIEAMLVQLLENQKKKPVQKRVGATEYPEWFENVWSYYPKRAGANPKGKAFGALNARSVKGYLDVNRALIGVQLYAAFCKSTGKTGTEYVMQAATFFGPDKHYENDWTIPVQPKKEQEKTPEQISTSYKKYDPAAKAEIIDAPDPWAALRGEG